MTDQEKSSTVGEDGMAHMQAAAREMIGAARALLDAAEALVEDPATVGKVVGVVTNFAQAAARTATPPSSPAAADADDASDDGPVERIVVR